jgi:hypothetical protein
MQSILVSGQTFLAQIANPLPDCGGPNLFAGPAWAGVVDSLRPGFDRVRRDSLFFDLNYPVDVHALPIKGQQSQALLNQ